MYGRGPSFRDRLARFMYGRRGYDELTPPLEQPSLRVGYRNMGIG